MDKSRQTLRLSQRDKDEILRQYRKLVDSQMYSRDYISEKFPYSIRDDYQRDYGRVLYSPSFRRLQGKMQILGINSAAFHRNRLTHSLEVCQIATSIAIEIAKTCNAPLMYAAKNNNAPNDIFCLQAAALCHDIGHPAFGHSGERTLDKIARNYGLRFEGNAQNYRVLRMLDKYDPEWKGLNLTHRTLLAINKYNVKEDGNVKKFMFNNDYEALHEFREKVSLLHERTLDAQIIEVSDDIAYAVHDLEDALACRSFSIEELCYILKRKLKDEEHSYKAFEEMIETAEKIAKSACSYHTPQEYSQVFRKKLTSLLTHKLIYDVTLGVVTHDEAVLHGTHDGVMEIRLGTIGPLCSNLKDAIFDCATREEDIVLYEKRGSVVIKSLFEALTNPEVNVNGKLLPPDYRNPDTPNYNVQGSIDFIAGMMDTFAIQKYEELFGTKFDEIPISRKD